MTKCKLLPTKTISRGKFRGINDIRRFQCFKSQCNLNFNEYQLCKYCSNLPYVSLPLRTRQLNNHNHIHNQDQDQDQKDNINNTNSGHQYRSIKIDYIPPTRNNAILRRNSNNNNNNKLITSQSVMTFGTSTNSGTTNGGVGDLTNKLNEFWDHLEMSKLQIKQRFMDIKIQKHKLSFKKRSFSAPPPPPHPPPHPPAHSPAPSIILTNNNNNSTSTSTTTTNNNNSNNENIYYSTSSASAGSSSSIFGSIGIGIGSGSIGSVSGSISR